MGVKITKDNIDEYITSYIDGEINDPKLEKDINDILSKDDILLRKYLSETLTKRLIQSRIHHQEVPGNLFANINNSIENLIDSCIESKKVVMKDDYHPLQTSRSFPEYFKHIISVPVNFIGFSVPRYALAVLLILIIFGTSLLLTRKNDSPLNPYIANGSDKSIMVQAINNFHKILKGEFQPQISSHDENVVRKYLKDNLDYEVYVPCIENCQTMSVICNEYNGQKIAHIVYRSGDNIFYICETPSKSLNNKCLEIPDPVHNEIVTKKFYMCDKVDSDNDCTMLLWYSGNVICASVSNMPKQKMYATFSNFK